MSTSTIFQLMYNLLGSIVIWGIVMLNIEVMPGATGIGNSFFFMLIILPVLALLITPTLLLLLQDFLPIYNRDKSDLFRYFGAIAVIIIVYPMFLFLGRVPLQFPSFIILANLPHIVASGMILWSVPVIIWKIKYENKVNKRNRH